MYRTKKVVIKVRCRTVLGIR